MRSTMRTFSLGTLIALAACAKPDVRPIIEEVPVEVPVAVATGCVATSGRPAGVKPLKDEIAPDEWKRRAPGARAEAVRAKAGQRQNYAEALMAATSACK